MVSKKVKSAIKKKKQTRGIRVVRMGSMEKARFEQRPNGTEGLLLIGILEKNVPEKWR